jgi:menaquinone-dependent protoporphyrinogen oxidase
MTKTLIAFAGKHGCAEECAGTLAEKIGGDTVVWNLKEKKQLDLGAFDKIVIGGSIYAGRIMKEAKEFARKNEAVLEGKTLGLFICGTAEGDTAKQQLEGSFPPSLCETALAKESFGGKLIMSKMNFLEKKIIKAVAKVESDMSNLSQETIEHFAKTIREA